MSQEPLVTIICICYNHEKFLEEALNSVFVQTYRNIEVVVIDDFSTDESNLVIERIIKDRSNVKYIKNVLNQGICKSFNEGLKLSKGEYIVDFATDDVMMPDRIEKQVRAFQNLDASFGVIYTNSINIDENGNVYRKSRKYDNPSGDIYKEIIQRYFISPPTVIMRRELLLTLGGYDESLLYEDFDFWVRSSRMSKYYYIDEPLTKRRILKNSLASKFNNKGENKITSTTYRVIQKILWLNKSEEENMALAKRLRYELRHSFYLQNYELVKKYFNLLKDINYDDLISRNFYLFALIKVPVFVLYKFYSNIRSRKD